MQDLAAGVSASVRRADARDAGAVADLVNQAYEVERFFVEGQRTSAAEIEALTARGEMLVLDDVDGGLAAAVHVAPAGVHGTFGMLSVAPQRQGQGLGKRMVAVAEAMCSAMGCTTVGLRVVNVREELAPWYRRLGYEAEGTAPYVHRETKRPCHFIEFKKALA